MAGIGATVALIKALAPKADPAVIQQAVEDYLEAHPEISVADGSITEEKLAADVVEVLSNLETDVSDVKNHIQGVNKAMLIPIDIANSGLHFYIGSNGKKTESNNWNAAVIYDVQRYKEIEGAFGTNDSSLLGIAFYDTTVISTSTFISGIAIGNSGTKIKATVPQNAVCAVICTRPQSYADYYANLYFNAEYNNGKINALSYVEKYIEGTEINVSFEQGTISSSSGEDGSNTKRIRTVGYINAKEFSYAICDINHKMWLYNYADDKGTFISGDTTSKAKIEASDLAENAKFIRIVVVNADTSTVIAPTDTTGFVCYADVIGKTINKSIDENNQVTNLGAYPKPLFVVQNATTGSDYTIIGNKFVKFGEGSDDLTERGTISYRKYENGFDQNPGGEYFLYHYFGHCNTVDYNAENGCLILGNGSGSYNLPGKIYIIPDFNSILDNAEPYAELTLQNTNAIIIDCSEYNMGTKFNALWGEKNGTKYNIIYLITATYGKSTSSIDAGDVGTIRKILLGMGTNELTFGQFISGKSDDEFNGTFNIIETYTQDGTAYKDCCQGSCYFKGEIVCAIGHDTLNLWRINVADGKIKRKEYHQNIYNGDGTVASSGSTGVCTDGKYIYTGIVGVGVWALDV